MDDDIRRSLVAEVERLNKLNRADSRRLATRCLLVLTMLAAAFAVGWYALAEPAERLIWEIFPFGIG